MDPVVLLVNIVDGVLDRLRGGPSRRLHPVVVRGRSMEPTFFEGDRLAVRTLLSDEPKVDQFVTALVDGREVIKRVTADTIDGFFLTGDNRAMSTDPGPVPREAITGIVYRRYWPMLRRKLKLKKP